jgi:hypothetical protein
MDVKSDNDRPFDIAVPSFCWVYPERYTVCSTVLQDSDQFDQRFSDPANGPDQYLLDRSRLDRVDQRQFTWAAILAIF